MKPISRKTRKGLSSFGLHLGRNHLRVTAHSSPMSAALGSEVHIIQYRCCKNPAEPFDLAHIKLPEAWKLVDNVRCNSTTLNSVLRATKGSIYLPWRDCAVITFLSHPWSGSVELKHGACSVLFDLFNEETCLVTYCVQHDHKLHRLVIKPVQREELSSARRQGTSKQRNTVHHGNALKAHRPLGRAEARIETEAIDAASYYQITNDCIAVVTPRWKGVTQSTKLFFRHRLLVPASPSHGPESVDAALIQRAVDLILESPYEYVVFSGGDLFQLEIAKRIASRKQCRLLWHSNYLQTGEVPDWSIFRHWLDAVATRLIGRIAVVRRGYHKYLQALGIDACFVPNQPAYIPTALPQARNSNTVGIWLSGSSDYRKSADVMLAAAISTGMQIKMSGCTNRELALLRYCSNQISFLSTEPLPFEELQSQISSTALTLYITASESSPMLPIESFSLGVPCVIGANSHLFTDDVFLNYHLRVCNVGSCAEIADKIRLVLDNYNPILAQYGIYANRITRLAENGLKRLLS
jgi:hypothetical protein